jgi:hypothetical protein
VKVTLRDAGILTGIFERESCRVRHLLLLEAHFLAGVLDCVFGGQRIDVGRDDSVQNCTLEPAEIIKTTYVCNGSNGMMGANGTSALFRITREGPGVSCPTGGQKIDVGLDNGDGSGVAGNGTLEAGEIDQTTYVCNGAGALFVPNFSFELPGDAGVVAPGWTANLDGGSGGFNNALINGFPTLSAAEGAQFHFVNLTSFAGPNPSFTESNAAAGVYTLTVACGRRSGDNTTDGTYVIELRSGGVVVGTKTVNNPAATYVLQSWNEVTATSTIASTDSTVGGDLTIRLIATNGTGGGRSQGQFDNVRLSYHP